MQTIILKLDPAKLENPDLDLRYRVPERVEAVSGGRIQDNGYDYLDGNALGLWLKAESAAEAWPELVQLLREERFCNNDLSQSAEIYLSEADTDELDHCTQVYPA